MYPVGIKDDHKSCSNPDTKARTKYLNYLWQVEDEESFACEEEISQKRGTFRGFRSTKNRGVQIFFEGKPCGALSFISNKDTSSKTNEIIKLWGSQSQKIELFESKATLASLCATPLASRLQC